MFIRSKEVKGATYYQMVEGYRDAAGKVRHRTVISLGRHPTIEEAIAAVDRQTKKALKRRAQLREYFPSAAPRWALRELEVIERRLTQQKERRARLAEAAERYDRPRREDPRETGRLNDAEARTWYVPALAEACRRRDEGIDCDWCGKTLADVAPDRIVPFGGRRYCLQYCADARRRNPIVPYPTGD